MKGLMKKSMCMAMTALVLSGCSGKTKGGDAQTTTPQATENLSEGKRLAKQYTGFEETPMDLGGREIKFVSTAANRYTYAEEKDKTPNDTLAIIDALKTIEKDYNCKITVEMMKGKDMVSNLLTAKAAGQVYCDILEFGVTDTYIDDIYSNNLVMPLEDPNVSKVIKLDSNPWLPQTGFGKMFGHQYGVHFKTSNSGDLLRGVLLFNKNLAEKYKIGNLYDMVKKDTWTFDKFAEISASIASQAGGKIYPIAYSHEGIYNPLFVYANNGVYAENTDKGYVFKALSENNLEAANFAVDLVKKGFVHPTSGKTTDIEKAFANGESVFFFGNYATLKKFTTGSMPTEDKFGLLPAPRGPHGKGYNSVAYTDALFHVMNNVQKPEQVAAVLTAIANRTSQKDIIQNELMYTLQDEESADMLKLMLNNVALDSSRIISAARGPLKTANLDMLSLQKTPKEAYESMQTELQAAFDAVKQK
jgi:ABC-type glycerol-3-phosphate transport system substrate-binding protein